MQSLSLFCDLQEKTTGYVAWSAVKTYLGRNILINFSRDKQV